MADDVLIAGAGIGGLAGALSLHARGIPVSVVEAVGELRPLGVGINVLPRAVGVLSELGLAGHLESLGVPTATNVYCNQHGAIQFREARGLSGGYRWPQYSIHRGRLQMMLLEAVRERLGPHAVTTGCRVTGFEQDTDSVRVRTADGDLTAAVLVGADGLHSTVRAHLIQRLDPLLWSGVRMWRGVTQTDPFLDGVTMALARDDAGVELVAYPIGDRLVNWVALVRTDDPKPLSGTADWRTPGLAQDVLEHFGHWELGWLDVPELITGSIELFQYPMVDREPLACWGTGRVSLLGDAAHPMYPVGANGGTQAILDADALAVALAHSSPGGLTHYEMVRRTATNQIITANRRMHRTPTTHHGEELAAVTSAYRISTGADNDLPGADR